MSSSDISEYAALSTISQSDNDLHSVFSDMGEYMETGGTLIGGGIAMKLCIAASDLDGFLGPFLLGNGGAGFGRASWRFAAGIGLFGRAEVDLGTWNGPGAGVVVGLVRLGSIAPAPYCGTMAKLLGLVLAGPDQSRLGWHCCPHL